MKNCFFRFSLPIFFVFSFCVNSCAQPVVSGDFYLGLAEKTNVEKIQESIKLFEKSLKDSNLYIRQAAADELAGLISTGAAISGGTAERVKKEASMWWAAAFEAVKAPNKEKALEFLFKFDQSAPIETKNYVLGECAKQGITFSEEELAAIEGHFAILNFRYNEALSFFRTFQEDGSWPQHIPHIFLQYPELINDLGRAFQYTSYGAQGLSLFSSWENNLTDNAAVNVSDSVKYRLVFYKARIARRNGQNTQAISFFEQAANIAPDTEQSQACIWYMLDLSARMNSALFIQQLEKFIPQWDKGNYFNDVLEFFLQTLVSKRDWKSIIQVFGIIRGNEASAKAAYVWVIARGIEEGLLSDEEKNLVSQAAQIAAQAAGQPETAVAAALTQIAYNAAENDISSFFYYRSLSAKTLGKPLIEIPSQAQRNGKLTPAGQFLLGFFTHNVPQYSMRYIRQLEEKLSIDELRVIANALENAGMYIHSIQLVLRYIEREGHAFDVLDMELLFPRPYIELVDMYAAQIGIEPQLLYALIRTESAFQSDIVSSAGAVGLTQLMPDTAVEMAGRIRRAGGTDYTNAENGLDLNDPAQNIHIGAYYLKYLSDRFEDTTLSLLAYNGGMNRVRRLRAASALPVDLFLETISISETRDYGRKVIAAAAMYEYLYYSQK